MIGMNDGAIGRNNEREGSMQLDSFLREVEEERQASGKGGAPDMSMSLDIGGLGLIDEKEGNARHQNITSEEFETSKIQLESLPSSSNFGSILGSFRKRLSTKKLTKRSSSKHFDKDGNPTGRKKFVRFKKFETFFSY